LDEKGTYIQSLWLVPQAGVELFWQVWINGRLTGSFSLDIKTPPPIDLQKIFAEIIIPPKLRDDQPYFT